MYSDYGYGLLELLRERITEPLGMTRTGLDTPGPVHGHDFFGRPTPPWDLAALAGTGGFRSFALLKGDTLVIALHARARRVNGHAFKALKAAEARTPAAA